MASRPSCRLAVSAQTLRLEHLTGLAPCGLLGWRWEEERKCCAEARPVTK